MTLSNILSTLAAMGLQTLREQLALARIVNRDYEPLLNGGTKFATVNVTVPAAVAAVDVTPANVPPTTVDQTPTVVPVTLSQWKEAPFTMNDKDFAQVDAGILPMQANEAIKGLANTIEDFLWSLCSFYSFTGTPGTAPFGVDATDYLEQRRLMNVELAPMDNRFEILDPSAESNALNLRGFQDASFGGGDDVILRGQIGQKLGALWLMSQRVPTQSPGTTNGAYVVNGAHSLGATSIVVATGTGTMLKGSIITFSGDPQTYAIQTDYAGGAGSISILPGLRLAKSGAETITSKAAFVKNLLIHRDAIAFAMAALVEQNIAPNLVAMQSIVDPISGLALRVEVTREHKRWRWSYDALYGGALVRGQLGAIAAG